MVFFYAIQDIAMNYLVAHLSRKPTLKVFSKCVLARMHNYKYRIQKRFLKIYEIESFI